MKPQVRMLLLCLFTERASVGCIGAVTCVGEEDSPGEVTTVQDEIRCLSYLLSHCAISLFMLQASDGPSTKRVLVAIVQMCFDTEDWESLNENIMVLTKRRGQLKMAIQAMVEECCKFINQTPNRETKLKLISTLRVATEGKVMWWMGLGMRQGEVGGAREEAR